jgi:hypothetical protein
VIAHALGQPLSDNAFDFGTVHVREIKRVASQIPRRVEKGKWVADLGQAHRSEHHPRHSSGTKWCVCQGVRRGHGERPVERGREPERRMIWRSSRGLRHLEHVDEMDSVCAREVSMACACRGSDVGIRIGIE